MAFDVGDYRRRIRQVGWVALMVIAVPVLLAGVGLTIAPGLAATQIASESPNPNTLLRVRPADRSQRLRIEVVEDLRFGRFVAASNRSGEISIHPATGNWTFRGGVYDLGGSRGRASFVVRGKPKSAFSISLPRKLELNGAGSRVSITGLSSHPKKAGKLGPNGMATIHVGGTLKIKSKPDAGDYRGTIRLHLDRR